VGELAERVGITPANLAVLENGRAQAVRFATLTAPGGALEYQPRDHCAGMRSTTPPGDVGRRRSQVLCAKGFRPVDA
jgi:hypothetical protein